MSRSGIEPFQTDAHGVGVGIESLAVGKRGNGGSQILETIYGELLRGDVLLEG